MWRIRRWGAGVFSGMWVAGVLGQQGGTEIRVGMRLGAGGRAVAVGCGQDWQTGVRSRRRLFTGLSMAAATL